MLEHDNILFLSIYKKVYGVLIFHLSTYLPGKRYTKEYLFPRKLWLGRMYFPLSKLLESYLLGEYKGVYIFP